MALNIYPFSHLTGGTDDSYLDFIDGDDLSGGEMAFGIVDDDFFAYSLHLDSGASESSPDVISPDSNAGNKRWHLCSNIEASIPPA